MKRVGIIGGGQLSRMLCLAAYPLGLDPVIFVNSKNECAVPVASEVIVNDKTDDSLKSFFERVDLATTENEFLDLNQIQRLDSKDKLLPQVSTLLQIQNKILQKMSFEKYKVSTLPFLEINNSDDLDLALQKWPQGLVIKKAEFGYDGRGVHFVKNKNDLLDIIKKIDFQKTYAEPLASFKKELAVIAVRSVNGEMSTFPIVESHQEKGQCAWTLAPAAVSKAVQSKVIQTAKKILKQFDVVGAIGIELFQLKDNSLVVNEIAPRVHNTGHYTLDGCLVSQFEQHWRALFGMPLQKTDLNHKAVAMMNIIGSEERQIEYTGTSIVQFKYWPQNAKLYWYGKTGFVLNRKLGHINAVANSTSAALKLGQKARKLVKI